jgi:type IV pilus assembly protein PilQ
MKQLRIASAADNPLITLKTVPLPYKRIRFDFCFKDPIVQLPASFITQKPPRLVLDFVDTMNQVPTELQSKSLELSSLTRYQVVGLGHRVRVIFELSGAISYSGHVAGSTYSLIINGKGNQLISSRKEVFITNRPINAKHIINNIDFRGSEKQGGRVIIDVSDTGIPIDILQDGKELLANFMSTRLPPTLARRFDVTDFHSPTQFITAKQDGRNVRIGLMNKGDYGHFAYQVNKQFIIDVFPLTPDEIQQQKLKKNIV